VVWVGELFQPGRGVFIRRVCIPCVPGVVATSDFQAIWNLVILAPPGKLAARAGKIGKREDGAGAGCLLRSDAKSLLHAARYIRLSMDDRWIAGIGLRLDA
jgi:hypothetical protein